MTPHELARHLRAARVAIDSCRPDLPEVVEGIGDAYITIDPESDSPYPSANRNTVQFMGCTVTVSREDVGQVVDLFSKANCERFFVWLSPCAQGAEIKSWLTDQGLKRFAGTTYPTLLRPVGPVSPHETKLKVRQFEPAQATASARELEKVFGDRSWAEFVVSSSRLENFDHFGVYAGRNLVGVGGLYHKDDVAYIGWAATSESHRGKGGQSALITARINRAHELGCRWMCSETLTKLKTSLSNLQRNGFEIVYKKEVYVWKRT